MPATHAMFVRERKAAELLDMRVQEFRSLVQKGALPGPVRFERWDVEQLRKVMTGEAANIGQGLDL